MATIRVKRDLRLVVIVALTLKFLCVAGMMAIMRIIFFQLNPRLRELFASFSPEGASDPDKEKEFFARRARRKAPRETCLKFAVGVLVSSAFLGFAV